MNLNRHSDKRMSIGCQTFHLRILYSFDIRFGGARCQFAPSASKTNGSMVNLSFVDYKNIELTRLWKHLDLGLWAKLGDNVPIQG